jgi:hypothetical protein
MPSGRCRARRPRRCRPGGRAPPPARRGGQFNLAPGGPAGLRRSPAGRPMEHDLRAVLDVIRYVTKYGIER